MVVDAAVAVAAAAAAAVAVAAASPPSLETGEEWRDTMGEADEGGVTKTTVAAAAAECDETVTQQRDAMGFDEKMPSSHR